MFICKECAEKRKLGTWFFDIPISTSFGPCEDCNKTRSCVDYFVDMRKIKCAK